VNLNNKVEQVQEFLKKLVDVKEASTGMEPSTVSGTIRKKYTFIVALAYREAKVVGSSSRPYEDFEKAYSEAVDQAMKTAERLPDGEGWTSTYMCMEDTVVTVEVDNAIAGRSTKDITTKKRWLTPAEIKEMMSGIEQTRVKMVGIERKNDRPHNSNDS